MGAGGKNLKAVHVPTGAPVADGDGSENNPFSYLPDNVSPNDASGLGQSSDIGFDLPDQKPKVEGVYGDTSSLDPQRAAEVIQLSKRLQQPENFIDKNLDDVKKTVNAPSPSFFAEMEAQYPESTKFLSDPKNMAATHDDMPNVVQHEGLFQRAKNMVAFEKAAWQTGGLQEELAFMKYHQMMGTPNVGDTNFRFGSAVAAQAGITATDPAEREAQINAKLEELSKVKPEGFGLKQGIFGATSFAPQILSGFGYGLKGLPSKMGYVPRGPMAPVFLAGAAKAGFASGEAEYNFKLMSGQAFDSLSKMKDDNGQPLPPEIVKTAAIATGAAAASMSLVSLGAMMKTIPGGSQFMARFAAQAGEKVIENPATMGLALKAFTKNYLGAVAHGTGAMLGITAANIAGTEGAKAVSGQPFSEPIDPATGQPGSKSTRILGELGSAASDAVSTFGVMALPGTGMSLHNDISAARKTEQAQQFYVALGNTAEASKLRERLPEAHQALIARMTKDSPIENVYIPVRDAEVYFQGKNIDTEAAMNEIGAGKSYAEAKATGGDIQIPLSDWASKIVGTEHYDGLKDDIKFDPEDMTKRQVDQRREEIAGKIKEAEATSQGEETKQTSADKVHEDVAGQLRGAGYTDDQANQYAKIYGAAFKTLGERSGQDPADLFRQYQLRIRANRDPVAAIDKEIEGVRAEPQTLETAAKIEKLNQERVVMSQASDVKLPDLEKPKFKVTHLEEDDSLSIKTKKVQASGEFLSPDSVDSWLNEGHDKPIDITEAGLDKFERPFVVSDIKVNEKSQRKGIGSDALTSLEIEARVRGADVALLNASPTDAMDKAGKLPGLIKFYESQGYKVIRESEGNAEMFKPLNDTFEQGGGEGPRGSISFGKDRQFNIDVMKNADLSTFLHESGHFYLEVLGDLASSESAPKDIKDDFSTVLNWLGVESRDQIGVEQHEKFARGFEAYLMEGKAPSLELQSTFQKFKSWLVGVYKQLKVLNVQLTPEVSAVFDRMLATQSEIDQAQLEIGYHQDLIGQGIDPKVAERLHSLAARARDAAEQELMRDQVADMKAKNSEFMKSEHARLEIEGKERAAKLPIFKAMEELKTQVKGKESIAAKARKFLDGSMSETDQAHFEVAAEVHGFTDGKELASSIESAVAHDGFNAAVKAHVDAGMQQHAPLKDTAQIKIEALKAIHNEKMTDLLALEHQILQGMVEHAEISGEVSRRRRLEASVAAQEAKSTAKELLDSKPVKDAGNYRIYVTAERNAAKRVAVELQRKDFEKAAEAKQQQMLNHALAAEAMRNRAESEKTLRFLNNFATRGGDMMKMPYAFIRQVDRLLSGVGLTEPRNEDNKSLTKIAGDMAARGEEAGDIANATGLVMGPNNQWAPESLPQFIQRVNDNYYAFSVDPEVMSLEGKDANQLTIGELRSLKDAVKAIAQIGKKYGLYLGDYKTMDIREAAKEFRERAADTVGTPKAEDLLPGSKDDGPIGKIISAITNVSGALDRWLDNMLTVTDKFDGLKEGPAKDNIYRPIKEAEMRKMARLDVAMKELDGLFGAHYTPEEFAKYKDTRFNIDGRNFTKEEILAMALNWGNDGNKDRLMRGFKFDQDKMQRIFQHLGKKDWDFAQSVWDHLHTFWPDIVKLEMDVAGSEPKSVQAAAFENEHGSYRGGYYPIKYDFEKSADAFKNRVENDALYKTMSVAKAQTAQGHTEARVQTLARPLRLSLDVLKSHYEDIIHDLEFRRAVIDVNRFMMTRDAKGAIINALGVRGLSAMQDWLKAAASGTSEPIAFGDEASRWLRFRTTFFNLGYRLMSTPKIALENMVNVSSELGVSGAARAVKEYYMDGNVTHDMVVDKSEFMKQRATHLNRDFADITEWKGNAQGPVKKYAFAIHAILDGGFSFPLWADVYQRAIADHGDEKLAVNQADEAVKKTFMSGGRADQPAIMRGSEKQKLLTMAYSYQSMMWNRYSTAKFQASMEWAQGNHAAAAAVIARATVYQFIMPALIASLTREFLRNTKNQNQDDQNKRVIGTIAEEMTPLKLIPILRDVTPFLVKRSLGEPGSHITTSPLESTLETLLKPPTDLVHSVLGHKPLPDKFGEESVNAISLLTGVPKQVNDITFNFIDWQKNQGELTWRDFISRRTKK